jgi:hypothetical protein
MNVIKDINPLNKNNTNADIALRPNPLRGFNFIIDIDAKFNEFKKSINRAIKII